MAAGGVGDSSQRRGMRALRKHRRGRALTRPDRPRRTRPPRGSGVSEPKTGRRSALRLLQERVASLPEMLERIASSEDPPLAFRPGNIRGLVATGLGSSAAHARYLTALVTEHVGLPARFVPMSGLATLPE